MQINSHVCQLVSCKPLWKDGWKVTQGSEKDQDGGWHKKRKHIRRDEEESGESRRVEGSHHEEPAYINSPWAQSQSLNKIWRIFLYIYSNYIQFINFVSQSIWHQYWANNLYCSRCLWTLIQWNDQSHNGCRWNDLSEIQGIWLSGIRQGRIPPPKRLWASKY